MRTKKSLKLIYDENRLLYAKKYLLTEQQYDPAVTQLFLEQFHAKKRLQKKKGIFVIIFSGLFTATLVYYLVEALNILLQ